MTKTTKNSNDKARKLTEVDKLHAESVREELSNILNSMWRFMQVTTSIENIYMSAYTIEQHFYALEAMRLFRSDLTKNLKTMCSQNQISFSDFQKEAKRRIKEAIKY